MPFQKPGRGDPSSNTFGTADAPPKSSPATFGTADASSKSSSLTPPTEQHRPVNDLGLRQTGQGQGQNPWPSLPDSGNNTRKPSPPKIHQAYKDARPKSPPLPAGPIRQGSSPSALQNNPSYAFSGAGVYEFAPHFPNGDGYTPLQQPGDYHPPKQGTAWFDGHPSRPNLRHSNKDTKESPVLKSSTLPQTDSTLRSLPVMSRDARVRPSSAQNQNSRLFASAIQQFKPNDDVHSVSYPYDIRNEMAKEGRARRFHINSDYPAMLSQNHDTAVQGVKRQSLDAKKLFSGEVQTAREIDNSAEVEGTDLLAEKDWRSAEAILGICPDMCPESERQERERKGDLDRLERLDGDRNQTSKDLAVKKYSRTAGKDSTLIRPLAVLLMTMEYLLHLLSRGYDEELLSLHNFLWDRMRAIRMDLRMQHIFNQQAVAMHEQMIRFHILAMHELCEYKKGEGFSEGFDAHLNIEQMNKTSVDLFHMYDDLRKAGNPCANEAEFRGYYALLKLDKHPGYTVEPAELSLDLVKMTPDMRNTTEVQFARKVARACRLGNYLAFFRLTREATYLQACLMHAHFAKLRSQAMASLHSGLQKNQGIPIVQVEEWLAMEGEDIVGLAEYHGFSLKNYEELYIVKEGPFLNRGRDFETRRSKLVEEKRSQIIKDDVLTSGHDKVSTVPAIDRVASFKKVATLDRVASFRRESDSYATVVTPADEEMPDYVEDEQQNEGDVVVPLFPLKSEDYERAELPMPNIAPTDHINPDNEVEHLMFQGMHHTKQGEWFMQGKHQESLSSFDKQQTSSLPRSLESAEQDKQNEWYLMGKRKKQSIQLLDQENALSILANGDMVAPSDKRPRLFEDVIAVQSEHANIVKEHKPPVERDPQEAAIKWAALEAEANRGKLCLILRRWKSRAAVKAEERRWMLQKLDTALGSFHLGLPVQINKVGHADAEDASIAPVSTFNLDIEQTETSRISKLENMWVGLDVSEIVAPILKRKNMASKFICWKILMCSGLHESETAIESKYCERNIACEWLRAKLLQHRPFDRENAEELPSTIISQELVCVPDLSQMCKCLFFYILKDVQCRRERVEIKQVGQGASGLIFMLREGSPLNEERIRLHEFVKMLQSGVQLPLLVLCPDLTVFLKTASQNPSVFSDDIEAVSMLLGINDLDKTKVGAWTVLSISEEDEAKFSQSCNISLEGSARMGRFFSEKILREGLSWLSSKAPKQPNLRSAHIQDLVLEHLKPLIKVLLCMEPTQVTPDLCIQLFNEALMKSAKEISDTASSFNLHCPPNELWEILEDDSLSGGSWLPSPGWNESTSLRPVFEALEISQLPQFQLLSRGTDAGSNSLKSQRIALEQSLRRYVNQLLGSRPGDLLTLQMVHEILQKGCILKQTDGNRVLLPNWSLIFQHFYIMRLALLKTEPPTVVYVFAREESVPDGLPDTRMDCGFTDHMTLTLNDILEMEQQEAAVLERQENSDYIMKNTGLSAVQKDAEESLSEPIHMSEDAVQDIFQPQAESVKSNRDVRSFISLIEHPSDEEIALQNLVDDFCRKVDQESAEAGIVEEHSLMAADDGSLPNDDWHLKYSNKNCINVLPASSKVCRYDEDCFLELLNRCEKVQKDIDKKLKEMGGIFS